MENAVASSGVVAPVPLFATVTFLGEENRNGSTFRVPISASTTVRRLAKDALQRLVLSRRNSTGCREGPAFVVKEVFVGGTGAQPKAEVFAQDCVMQVVSIKEEVVYMSIKGIGTSASSPQHTSLQRESRQSCESSAAGCIIAAFSDHSAQPTTIAVVPSLPEEAVSSRHATVPATMIDDSASETTALLPAATKPSEERTEVQGFRGGKSTALKASMMIDEPAPNAELRENRQGWGSEAYGLLTPSYVSIPGKRPRAAKPPKNTQVPGDKSRKTEMRSHAAAGYHEDEEFLPCGKSTVEDKRLGWGPEASKHFPDNFVSSPERLVRHQRGQKQGVSTSARNKKSAPPTALTNPVPKEPVSRVLQYPTAEAKEGRDTVGHAVEDAIVVDEALPPVELPKGWGRESLRFFDPNTYCDDPAKARLLPNMDYSRSRRERHFPNL